MSYISFTILTTDAKELRDRLLAYGWLVEGEGPGGVDPIEGFEYAEVPNPIIVSGTGTGEDPFVRDTRRVFLCKIAHGLLFDETKDDEQFDRDGKLKSLLLRTRFGKFIAANSTADTVDSLAARKLGTKFWLVANGDNSRFGIWQ